MLIRVQGLTKRFESGLFRTRGLTAVDNVSFEIARGETLGLCGESGCGKSTVGRCLIGLLEPTAGRILLDGKDLQAEKAAGRSFRRRVQIIFQDADGALDPRMKIRNLLLEPLKVHGLLNGNAGRAATELMDLVGLTPELLDRYPHELSGGQRQRIGIARAVCLNPDFLVADEPTASLDLLVQAQMLDLLRRIQQERGIGCLLISHHLSGLKRSADRLAVMYMGRLVEIGLVTNIFNRPAHPYTRALFDASALGLLAGKRRERPAVLGDDARDVRLPDAGCPLFKRCPWSLKVCAAKAPEVTTIGFEHKVWCHSYQSPA